MRCSVFLFFLMSLMSCKAQTIQTVVLVENNQSNYQICIPPNAGENIIKTVRELQSYFFKIGNVKLSITTEKSALPQIIIGGKDFMESRGIELPYTELKKDGFIIKTENKHLLISGINEKGIINGIYTLLEKYLGCRFYARDAIVIPQKENIILEPILDIQNPAFEIRMLNSYEGLSVEYCKWHKLDLPPRINPLWLKPWIHTTTKYFSLKWGPKKHPEYFTYFNKGKDAVDINYENNEVLEIMIGKIKKRVQDHPTAKFIGASQGDMTRKIKSEDKGKISGDMTLGFANRIAQTFPDHTITYLAYQYSRSSSENIKPLGNILVIICNTWGNRTKAVDTKNPGNKFIKDLQIWQKLTDNIMVWDYIYNTKYEFAPYPNFYLLQQAIKGYKDLGINKIFEESHRQPSGGLYELRSYLTAKLLWNPDLDIDSLITDFLNGYYGDAAPYIKNYIQEMNKQLKASKIPLLRTGNPKIYSRISFLRPLAIRKYELYLEKAKRSVVDDPIFKKRVDKVYETLKVTKSEIGKRSSKE